MGFETRCSGYIVREGGDAQRGLVKGPEQRVECLGALQDGDAALKHVDAVRKVVEGLVEVAAARLSDKVLQSLSLNPEGDLNVDTEEEGESRCKELVLRCTTAFAVGRVKIQFPCAERRRERQW